MDLTCFHFSSAEIKPCGHRFVVEQIAADLACSTTDVKLCQLAPQLLSERPPPYPAFRCPECRAGVTAVELDERATLSIPSGTLLFEEVNRSLEISPELQAYVASLPESEETSAFPLVLFFPPATRVADLTGRIPFITFEHA